MSWVRNDTRRLYRVSHSSSSSVPSIELDSSFDFGFETNLENHFFNNMAKQAPRTLTDYLQPTQTTQPSCIILPKHAQNFNIKHGMMSVILQFHGMESENPY